MMDSPLNIFVAVFSGYVLTSVFFLKNPSLLHRKKNIKFTCRHISHRGGAGESYENTLAAFRRAALLGTDMLEMDCHLTKDRQVVVSHDGNLLRAAGLNRNIADLDYRDLPPLKKTLTVDFDPGVSYTGDCREEERRIPLLREVFLEFPGLPINIDIKADDDALIEEVDRLITSHNRAAITVWGSFSDHITYKCFLRNPEVKLLFSLRRVVQLMLLFYSGLLPFVPLRESHLEIFLPSIYLRSQWRLHGHSGGNFMVHWPPCMLRLLETLLMRKSLFQHLHRRGIQTYVWVLNSEEEFKKAFDLGVTGVMTDYPLKLKRFMEQNPEYSPLKEAALH